MRNCIFGVWHTNEVLPLFEYIKSTQGTARPLTLAGFDTQLSSSLGASYRPAFFANLVRAIDPARGPAVETTDREHITGVSQGPQTYPKTATGPPDRVLWRPRILLPGASGASHRALRRGAAAGRRACRVFHVAVHGADARQRRPAGRRRPRRRRRDSRFRHGEQPRPSSPTICIRDRKIMIWAHNFHIRHDNSATTRCSRQWGSGCASGSATSSTPSGCTWIAAPAAQNNRVVYSINPGPVNSMEWVMANTGSPLLFMDFLHQQRDRRQQLDVPVQRRSAIGASNPFTDGPARSVRRRPVHRHRQVARPTFSNFRARSVPP